VGGWLFGRVADRHGRRVALVSSVLVMGAGSLMIALLPTHATIGAWAPVLLLLARLLQGLSTGGQFAAAAAYLSEVATDARRGFYASFLYVTLIAGQLGALLTLFLLQQWLDEQEIRAWGWRIPFLIGAVVAFAVLFLRSNLHETVGNGNARAADAGSLRALARHPRELLTVMALTAGGGVCLYTFTIYMQKFLVNTTGLDIESASWVMLVAMPGFMLLQPAMGALSDSIGRRRCLLIFSGLMTLAAVPLLHGLAAADSRGEALLLVWIALVIISFYTSISGLFKAELFPAHVRALGVGLAHSVSIAIFGGTAEYLALFLKRAGSEEAYFWYVAAVCAACFITAFFMREPRRASMAD
jgi:MFS family permease